MLKAIAVVAGATAFQLITAGAQTRSGDIGDVVRLLLFACALTYFIRVLPGARADARRSSRNMAQQDRIGRRVVTLTLRS